jgi:hypothetical protein
MGLFSSTILMVLGMGTSAIKSDETVIFYPGYAAVDEDGGHWSFTVQGCIFEPDQDSWRRGLLVTALRKTLKVQPGTPEAKVFDQRARLFLVDHERGKTISVRIGSGEYAAGKSESNGRFQAAIRLPAAEARRLARPDRLGRDWIEFAAVTGKGDDRRFAGRVQLIGRKGLSIVSDIDDTIKHTGVTDPQEMLANTFLRAFRPVQGMAALYARAAKAGAAVHYVSASPWQLFEPLSEFLAQEGFPAGSFHLKLFRPTDSSALNLLGSQEGYKSGQIEPLLRMYPGRRFILIGDSSEQDPEIYGRLARAHPDQVAAIWIRNVTKEPAGGQRFRKAFKDVDITRWRVFEKPEELGPALEKLIEQP